MIGDGSMCELFGVSSREPMIYNKYLKDFFKHSTHHPHGWGLASFENGNVQIEKEPVQASKSRYLKERLKNPVAGTQVLAHIRYATIGNLEYANCHPFTGVDVSGRRWTMIHNGTIFEFDPISSFVKLQQGETDSERIFLYLIALMNQQIEENGNKPLKRDQRFAVLDDMVIRMAPHNKLNLLIFDGEYLYVHTNCEGTLHYCRQDGAVMFTTNSVGGSQLKWKPVPMTRLFSYKNGRLIRKGTDHGSCYVENPEDMKLLYQYFSHL